MTKSSFVKADLEGVKRICQNLREEEAVQIPAMSVAPTLHMPQVDQQYRLIAEEHDMDPYEVRGILEFAPRSDHPMVREAFRKFVMIAKLVMDPSETGMDKVNAQIHQCRKHFDDNTTAYQNKCAERERLIQNKTSQTDRHRASLISRWHGLLDGMARSVTQVKGQTKHMPVWDLMLAQTLAQYDGGTHLRIVKGRIVWSGATLDRLKAIQEPKLIETAVKDTINRHQSWLNERASLSLDFNNLPDDAMEVLHLISDMQEQGVDDRDPMMYHLQEQFGWYVRRQRNEARAYLKRQLEQGADGFECITPEDVAPEEHVDRNAVEDELLMHGIRLDKPRRKNQYRNYK